MSDQVKFVLDETHIPKTWYNLVADLPKPLPPVLHPGTKQPIGPADLEPLFPMELILQEVSAERYIDIPEPVRDVYRMWRPSPLIRARRLEQKLGTPAKIYFKYEGVSPAGSHKPNTAVPQAWYNQQAGIKRLSTETGAGQWGSSLAFAGALFGIDVLVFQVRVSFDQKPYRRALMETYGARCIASPSNETNSGRAILKEHPDSPGSLGIAISEAVEVAAKDPASNTRSARCSITYCCTRRSSARRRSSNSRSPATMRTWSSAAPAAVRISPGLPSRSLACNCAAPQAAHDRGRAGGLPDADARPIRL